MRLRIVTALIALFGPSAAAALADGGDFIPRPFESGAYIDVFASAESDDNRSNVRSFDWTDKFIRERLTVFSNGYIYHPRFLLYNVSLAGALKQESYRASFLEDTGWTSSGGVEYDGRLIFLPEHPYNLELFARRYEPLLREQLAIERNNVETTRGAHFRYGRKPWFFNARLSKDRIKSGASTSDVIRAGIDGEYFRRFLGGNQVTFNAAWNPSEFDSSLGYDGRSSESLFGHALDLQRVRFSFSVTRNTFEQDSRSSGRFENEQLAWYELVSIYFPMNFRTDLTYRLYDNSSTVDPSGPSGARELSNLSKEFQLDIVHRLYESLDTRYMYLDTRRTSQGGDSDARSHAIAVNYNKSIPTGRYMAGLNFGRVDTENSGRTDIVNEPHPATAVPGSFTLLQQNIDPRSIAVFVRSPVAPFQIIQLDASHYAVLTAGATIEIFVTSLPPQFVLPGTFDLTVSYSLTAGMFELRTDTIGYTTSVQLLDDLVTPYYGFTAVRTRDVAGSFPGIPLDSTTHTGGVIVHKGPVRARGEYQNVDWAINPYWAWKAEVQVVGPIGPASRLYATASYLEKHYERGTSSLSRDPYDETTTSIAGGVQQQFPARRLHLSAGGSFTRLDGVVENNAYSLNSSLSWSIGKLEVSCGASAYRSETEGEIAYSNRRTDQYYYLKIRRELF